MTHRVAIIHGVNLDQLGRRPAAHYGGIGFDDLERQVDAYARELNFYTRFYQTNSESELIGYLHRLGDMADGIVINPGAWTHYAWAIHDALEITGLPAVEVHLSDVEHREPWRRVSVIRDVCVGTIAGRGVDGYRDALVMLRDKLDG